MKLVKRYPGLSYKSLKSLGKADEKAQSNVYDKSDFSTVRGLMASMLQYLVPIPIESVTFIKDADTVHYTTLSSQYT